MGFNEQEDGLFDVSDVFFCYFFCFLNLRSHDFFIAPVGSTIVA